MTSAFCGPDRGTKREMKRYANMDTEKDKKRETKRTKKHKKIKIC